MKLQRYIAERKHIGDRVFIRTETRPAPWYWWLPVAWWWVRLVWRNFAGARITARAAWDVGKVMMNIEESKA
ncbi:MAG TPA: hypothetical protein PK600_05480 [Deltaproteobacteria bacterium]|nr:hypothetical protein [Deltaproteobacteria bacterium]